METSRFKSMLELVQFPHDLKINAATRKQHSLLNMLA